MPLLGINERVYLTPKIYNFFSLQFLCNDNYDYKIVKIMLDFIIAYILVKFERLKKIIRKGNVNNRLEKIINI